MENLKLKLWMHEEEANKRTRQANSKVDQSIQTSDQVKEPSPAAKPLANDMQEKNEYQNSDCEEADDDEAEGKAADEDDMAETPQKNPAFDKYVDAQLLVADEPQPLRKSTTKPA